MIKFIEKTDKEILVLSPMRSVSPVRFCAKTMQQADKAKRIELLILCVFVAYCFNMYRSEFDGPALLFWGCVAQVSIYLSIWWFVPDLEIYDQSIHGSIKALKD